MNKAPTISCQFVDVGGVPETNGWDHHVRSLAAKEFSLGPKELESNHHLTFDTGERGKLTLHAYVDRVVFQEKTPFTRAHFRRFMFAHSQPDPLMIGLIARLKKRRELKVLVVSNEGRELGRPAWPLRPSVLALRVEHATLVDLRNQHRIKGETLRSLQRDVDLADAHLVEIER